MAPILKQLSDMASCHAGPSSDPVQNITKQTSKIIQVPRNKQMVTPTQGFKTETQRNAREWVRWEQHWRLRRLTSPRSAPKMCIKTTEIQSSVKRQQMLLSRVQQLHGPVPKAAFCFLGSLCKPPTINTNIVVQLSKQNCTLNYELTIPGIVPVKWNACIKQYTLPTQGAS